MEDRIERCAEKFAILFGAAPAGDEGTDPEFMKILQRFIFGEVPASSAMRTGNW